MDSSDVPRDYSLSSSEKCYKKEDIEEIGSDINKNINNNNNLLSKSMKLNFGVERILLKNYENKKMKISISKNQSVEEYENIKVIPDSKETENNSEFKTLNQQMIYEDINGLTNQNYILKPFPIRYTRNDKGKN